MSGDQAHDDFWAARRRFAYEGVNQQLQVIAVVVWDGSKLAAVHTAASDDRPCALLCCSMADTSVCEGTRSTAAQLPSQACQRQSLTS